jgi:hypothetical protein
MKANCNSIFVSIAAFRDTELLPTVERLLSNAFEPSVIYLNVFSQDENNAHPDLQTIVNQYGANLNYTKMHYLDTQGVCWVRSEILKGLTNKYTYYLQLDSHMAFAPYWDKVLIEDYENAHKQIGDFIYTVYPTGYDYIDEVCTLDVTPHIPRVPIYIEDKPTKFLPKEIDKTLLHLFPNPLGHKSFWFSGNFAFGYSRYFIETPYDPNFFFDGEEHSMSLRMFAKGVTFLSPPRPCVYHYYKTDRKVYVHTVNAFDKYYAQADQRIADFFSFNIQGEFGVTPDVIYKWIVTSRDNR